MYLKEDTDDKTMKTLTVELSQKISHKVSLYEYTGDESFLQLQKLYDCCLFQQDVIRKHAELHKLDNEVLQKIDTIPDGTANPD